MDTMLAAISGEAIVGTLTKPPSVSMNNSVDLAAGHSIFICETLKRDAALCMPPSYLQHFLNGELGMGKLFALCVSLFFYLVSVVVSLGSEKQVIWPDAPRIIAAVQDVHSGWNVPVVKFPRQSVRHENIAFQIYSSLKSSIAELVRLATPNPAVISLIDFAPKSLLDGFRFPCEALRFSPMLFHVPILAQYTIASQNKPLLGAVISGENLVSTLIWIVIMGVVWWLLYWLLNFVAPPQPFLKIGQVILALVAVIFLINILMGLAGHPLFTWR